MALTKVSTDGVKDDAVTTDKLANAINTERTANTAKASITINNNADNRVITGSGTANTLNGESNVVIDANGKLGIGTTVPSELFTVNGADKSALIRTSNAVGTAKLKFEADGTNYGGVGLENTAIVFRCSNNSSPTERLRIDSSGNVGINKTNPSSALDVNGVVEINDPSLSTDAKLIVKGNDTNNHDIIALYSNASTRGSFAIRTGTSISPSFLMGTRGSSETLAFMTDSTERLRVTDNGLTFNGDTAAANALDDYEEGSFDVNYKTGAAGGNTLSAGAYASTGGLYTKIGNMVHFQIRIKCSSHTVQGGQIVIEGLPFTHISSVVGSGAYIAASQMLSGSNNARLIIGGTEIFFQNLDGTAFQAGSGGVNFNNEFHCAGSYIAA